MISAFRYLTGDEETLQVSTVNSQSDRQRNEASHTFSFLRGVALQRFLNRLDLLRDGRQHALLQTVELVEAAPRPHLTQADEDTPHCLHTTAPRPHLTQADEDTPHCLHTIAQFHWISLDFTGFHWISLDFTGFHWISLDFTGFHWISLDFTGFNWTATP